MGPCPPADKTPRMPGERIELEGASNFRDLGGYPVARGSRVRSGRVFRSDGLHRLVKADIEKLEALDIEKVFDLRSDLELAGDGIGEFERRRGRHVHLPLIDVTLDPFDGSIDWAQMDLQQRYLEMLRKGGHAIRVIFEAAADPRAGPLVFHCSGGKDRTGVVSALLLRALGVSDDDVVADYAASQGYLASFIERYRDLLIERGIDPEAVDYLTSSPPERMRHTLAELDRLWGSTERYLGSVGVSAAVLEGLEARLLD